MQSALSTLSETEEIGISRYGYLASLLVALLALYGTTAEGLPVREATIIGPLATPIALSTAAVHYYDTGATIGSATPFPAANLSSPAILPVKDVDGLYFSSVIPSDETHFHTHISVFIDGVQAQMPWGIGMVGALLPAATDGVGYAIPGAVLGGSKGTFAMHTHDHSGIIHIEDTKPPAFAQVWTLGELFDLWGQAPYLDVFHFTQFLPVEPVHIYLTDNWLSPHAKATEYIGDFHDVPLLPLEEITVEVGDVFVPIPRYDFAGYFCPNVDPDPSDKHPTDRSGGYKPTQRCLTTTLSSG